MTEIDKVADWTIAFRDESSVPAKVDRTGLCITRRMLYVWSWDDFIWDLPNLQSLFAGTPAVFDYLFLTASLVSRASELVAIGDFVDGSDRMENAVLANEIQYAGVYRYFFMRELEKAVASLPRADDLEPHDRDACGRALLEPRVKTAETAFLRAIEGLCLGSEAVARRTAAKILGRNGKTAADMSELLPAPVVVRVDSERFNTYLRVQPCAAERESLSSRKRPVRSFNESMPILVPAWEELRLMCGQPPGGCAGFIDFGEGRIGYCHVTSGRQGRTLTIVCPERTIVCTHVRGDRLGARPSSIRTVLDASFVVPGYSDADAGPCAGGEIFLVRFDTGRQEYCRLVIRAHSRAELELVAAWRAENGGAASAGASGARARAGNPRTGVCAPQGPNVSYSTRYGVLQIFGDFEEARYNGGTVEIANSNQCRAVLRCLCEAGRIGPENAVTKHELYEYLRAHGLAKHVKERNWSPAQEFRALLSPLYRAVGRRNGKYWLKPDPKG